MEVSGRRQVPLCRPSSEEGAGYLCLSFFLSGLFSLLPILHPPVSALPGLGCHRFSCRLTTWVMIWAIDVQLWSSLHPRKSS